MSAIILPPEWNPVLPEQAKALEAELTREISAQHQLSNASFQCVARRDAYDDFLFSLESHPYPLAVVHLTWSVEDGPEFPWTTLFASESDFIENWRRILD